MAEWQRKIKYESELDHDFGAQITTKSRGETLNACIQCGTCSGTCPMSIYMDHSPRKIIAMTRAGFRDEVLDSKTIWLCASCYSCTVECPKQIRITDVMYALKQEAIQKKVYPKHFPVPVLAREFYTTVMRYGRSHESELLVRMYLKTNPFLMIRQAFLGLGLFLRGRMPILPEKIKARHGAKGDLLTIMHAVDKSGAEG